MSYILMTLLAAGIVAADQLSKAWVVNHIGPYMCADVSLCAQHLHNLEGVYGLGVQEITLLPKVVPGIDGVFNLLHVHNTGAAFSSFQGAQWLFALVFALFTLGVIYEFATRKMGFSNLERWLIVMIYAGGVGNMIDRLRLGFVVDMIETDFMRFPVFNVADCFITCGCIALMVSLVFFNKEFWKEDKK